MTDDELRAIEALWAQEPKDGMTDMLVDVVPELVAEVRRLKGVIKAACVYGLCPWCRGWDEGPEARPHDAHCPAFTPDGSVR